VKAREKLLRPPVHIPPCRCAHGDHAHTYGEGDSGLSLGPCKDCDCAMWHPPWHDRYPPKQEAFS
jgi:hypothetical protein